MLPLSLTDMTVFNVCISLRYDMIAISEDVQYRMIRVLIEDYNADPEITFNYGDKVRRSRLTKEIRPGDHKSVNY